MTVALFFVLLILCVCVGNEGYTGNSVFVSTVTSPVHILDSLDILLLKLIANRKEQVALLDSSKLA